MRVGRGLAKERAVQIVGPNGCEGADIARHARHESGDQRGDAQTQQARTHVARHHQRENVVIRMLACQRGTCGHQMKRQYGECDQTWNDDDERHGHLEKRTDDGGEFRRSQIFRGKNTLHDEEVGGPVAEADDEAEAEDDAGPVHAHGVILRAAERRPGVSEILSWEIVPDPRDHAGPSVRFDEAENRDEEGSKPDQEKLENLVKDRGEKTSSGDVDSDGERRNPNAEMNVPAEHDFHDYGHCIHIDARHEDGHERERDCAEAACGRAVTQLQVAGDGVRFRDVIKRHHDDAEEQHRGDRADPIPVRGEDAVLIRRARPAEQFERTKIRGEEAEARDPGRHLAAGEEKIFAAFGESSEVKSDGEHHGEVDDDDRHIDGAERNHTFRCHLRLFFSGCPYVV